MSFFTRLRRPPSAQVPTATEGDPPTAEATDETTDRATGDDTGAPRRTRLVVARVATVLAGLFVLVALIMPNEVGRLTPGAFVRIPVEGLVGVAILLVLPLRIRRVVGALAGAVLGLLTVMKVIDLGFFAVLDRPFSPLVDWPFLTSAFDFLTASIGRAGAIATAVGAVLLTVAVIVLLALSVLHLTRLAARHRTASARSAAVLGVAWAICAVLGLQLVPGVPVASASTATLAYAEARQARAGLLDRRAFASESSVDAFRDALGDQLLTGLRGKDVIFSFVESYGRTALEDPAMAAQVGAVLDDGTRRLRAAGYGARSGFLTSPTAGGGSWLAHATLLSGVWIDNQQRYHDLVTSDRLTLTGAFRRASWRTVAVMPSTTGDWPEASFYGYDKVYDVRTLGYQGPRFSFSTIPDQYTLTEFDRTEYATPGRGPEMVVMPLVSSHGPWVPLPRAVDWNAVGDGTVFAGQENEGDPADVVYSDINKIRAQYRRSIEYTLNSLISYVEKYGNDNLVLVFLGDHQPAPIVTGEGASRDVPITIVARDRAVLDRISGWGWQDGLKPGPKAPVWPMNAFRDRFLTAFGPQGAHAR